MTDEILKVKYPKEYEAVKEERDMTDPGERAVMKQMANSPSVQKISMLYRVACVPLASPDMRHHAFYITETVIQNLDHIKADRKDNRHYDWTVFNKVPEGKTTFIFRSDWLIRIQIVDGVIFYLHLEDHKKPTMFFGFFDRLDQSVFDPVFEREDMRDAEEFFYKLLLFFYFSKNEERVIEPGKSYGTKKQKDALDNSSDIPVTIVNCNWNITSIRLTGFDVAGHMRMQACGPGMKDHRLIFVQPYKKEGYVRKATNQINQQAA